MTPTLTLDHRQTYCRDHHGFWLGAGPTARLWVYVPAGVDPTDGLPITKAREATEQEERWWQERRYDRIASVLVYQGVPLPPRAAKPWWKRLLGR